MSNHKTIRAEYLGKQHLVKILNLNKGQIKSPDETLSISTEKLVRFHREAKQKNEPILPINLSNKKQSIKELLVQIPGNNTGALNSTLLSIEKQAKKKNLLAEELDSYLKTELGEINLSRKVERALKNDIKKLFIADQDKDEDTTIEIRENIRTLFNTLLDLDYNHFLKPFALIYTDKLLKYADKYQEELLEYPDLLASNIIIANQQSNPQTIDTAQENIDQDEYWNEVESDLIFESGDNLDFNFNLFDMTPTTIDKESKKYISLLIEKSVEDNDFGNVSEFISAAFQAGLNKEAKAILKLSLINLSSELPASLSNYVSSLEKNLINSKLFTPKEKDEVKENIFTHIENSLVSIENSQESVENLLKFIEDVKESDLLNSYEKKRLNLYRKNLRRDINEENKQRTNNQDIKSSLDFLIKAQASRLYLDNSAKGQFSQKFTEWLRSFKIHKPNLFEQTILKITDSDIIKDTTIEADRRVFGSVNPDSENQLDFTKVLEILIETKEDIKNFKHLIPKLIDKVDFLNENSTNNALDLFINLESKGFYRYAEGLLAKLFSTIKTKPFRSTDPVLKFMSLAPINKSEDRLSHESRKMLGDILIDTNINLYKLELVLDELKNDNPNIIEKIKNSNIENLINMRLTDEYTSLRDTTNLFDKIQFLKFALENKLVNEEIIPWFKSNYNGAELAHKSDTESYIEFLKDTSNHRELLRIITNEFSKKPRLAARLIDKALEEESLNNKQINDFLVALLNQPLHELNLHENEETKAVVDIIDAESFENIITKDDIKESKQKLLYQLKLFLKIYDFMESHSQELKNSNFKEEAQEALLNYIDNEKNKTNDVTKDLKEFSRKNKLFLAPSKEHIQEELLTKPNNIFAKLLIRLYEMNTNIDKLVFNEFKLNQEHQSNIEKSKAIINKIRFPLNQLLTN